MKPYGTTDYSRYDWKKHDPTWRKQRRRRRGATGHTDLGRRSRENRDWQMRRLSDAEEHVMDVELMFLRQTFEELGLKW